MICISGYLGLRGVLGCLSLDSFWVATCIIIALVLRVCKWSVLMFQEWSVTGVWSLRFRCVRGLWLMDCTPHRLEAAGPAPILRALAGLPPNFDERLTYPWIHIPPSLKPDNIKKTKTNKDIKIQTRQVEPRYHNTSFQWGKMRVQNNKKHDKHTQCIQKGHWSLPKYQSSIKKNGATQE